ncbi:hypothetical protein EIP91_009108 [Steccherinum ochraceum]|uniref:histone acetyltransferase n=1 Tax=Steccherinum ochraceum TaxID=92696 RepID=A0A4R0RRY2_9APHY|nr:hypothetical protein EIP91_009108 [Steccherinum ochraceum]
MILRDALLNSLSTLPGTRDFHIHVLASSPRKHSGLFPYAIPRPRAYIQDILILLSEQNSSSAPRVLVTAIEANVYNIPATSCGILYISKVDGTGQGGVPSPTSTLVKAFLRYFVDPETRPIAVDTLWVQLFARAQTQYLFPNSADFPGKKPLSDVRLCAWWRKLFTEVAEGLEEKSRVDEDKDGGGGSTLDKSEGKDVEKTKSHKVTSRLYYVLPGYNELEAIQSLKLPLNPSTPSRWAYGHPYSQTDIPLPCPPNPNPKGHTGLGHFIPSFDDDPKNRFIDEIALTTDSNGIKSPKKKKPKTTLRKPDSKVNGQSRPRVEEEGEVEKKEKETEKGKEKDEEGEGEEEVTRAQGELDKVSADEFWERMSFRQECIAGAVTGFFALGVTPPSHSRDISISAPSPLAPQPGQVAPRLVRRVVASLMNGHEFSTTERSVRATQVLEDAIKGLCENIASVPTSNPNLSSTAHLLFLRDTDDQKTSEQDGGPVDTAGAEAKDGDEDGDGEEDHQDTTEVVPRVTLEVPRTPPPRRAHLPEISPNPFPEPVTSLETYHSHIYGSVSVRNPALPPKSSAANGSGVDGSASAQDKPVRVLAVRKKKRKTDS